MKVVVFAPKYDSEIRSEYEVEYNERTGEIDVTLDKRRDKDVQITLGSFKSYEEAKEEMIKKLIEDFDRPSQKAIDKGRSPLDKIWNSPKGNQVRNSISLIEGDAKFESRLLKTGKAQVTITKRPPFDIVIQDIQIKYKDKLRRQRGYGFGNKRFKKFRIR